jgi:threonine/homoserine/homoserine lactone efflux protein
LFGSPAATLLFITIVVALVRGFFTGVAVSLPTGPVNVAVIRNSIAISMKMGAIVGAGAAIVDALYSLIVYLGIVRFITRVPALEPILGGLGCMLMIAYGAFCVFKPAFRGGDARRAQTAYAKALGLGAVMTLANPGPLLLWFWLAPATMGGLGYFEAVVFAVGVLAGGMAWFIVLSILANRGTMKIGAQATWITRAMGVALIGFGIYLGFRAGTKAAALL